MSTHIVRDLLKGVIQYYTQNPEQAISEDKPAMAVLVDGLRSRASNENGFEVFSDMPKAIGGRATAPTPGWLFRASLANCDVVMIAMRAAELGIELTTLEVTVSSTSDDRGLLQMDDSIHAGPLNVNIHVRLGARNATEEQLKAIVAWAERHSPVGDIITRVVPLEVRVDVV